MDLDKGKEYVNCTCGRVIFWFGKGRRPNTCADCRGLSPEAQEGYVPLLAKPANRRDRGDRGLDAEGRTPSRSTKYREQKERLAEKHSLAESVIAARKVAIGLRTTSNAEDAARLTGVDPNGVDDWEAVLAMALSEELRPLREGDRSATSAAIGAGTALLAERMVEAASSVEASGVPNALAQMGKVADTLGGFKKTYTTIKVSFNAIEKQTHMMATLRRIAEEELTAEHAGLLANKCLEDIRIGRYGNSIDDN